MGLFSSLFGCAQSNNKNQTSYPKKLEEIMSRTDTTEGFSDIFLRISSSTKTDSTYIFVGQGLYKNKKVGLKFEINSNIPYGITHDGEKILKGAL